MKKIALYYLLFNTILGFSQINYPITVEHPIIDSYHGEEIIDNYQWLENINNEDVLSWVKEQNKVSKKYLNKLINSNGVESLMNLYMFRDYENVGKEIQLDNLKDKAYFRIMYSGYNSPPAIYYKKGTKGSYDRLVSNSTISSKEPVVFDYYKSSMNDRFLGYQYSKSGSDWKEIRIVQINKRKYFKDVVKHVKSSGIYWLGQGFFIKNTLLIQL